MESLIARNGKIFCPDPECKSRRQHQIKGSDSSQKAFLDTQIVTHCASSVVAKYIHTVSYARVQTEAMVKIQEFVKEISKKLPQFDRECRRQSLMNACPDARMCRRCFYGPMEKSNCSNLQTHSHQYQNACPRCGDHASRWGNCLAGMAG